MTSKLEDDLILNQIENENDLYEGAENEEDENDEDEDDDDISEDDVVIKKHGVAPFDSVVNTVIQKFKYRSEMGYLKYGTTLDRTDLSILDWINHAQEEHMDAILYLEKLKIEYEKIK